MAAWILGGVVALAWLLALYQLRMLRRVRNPLAASYSAAFLFAALSRAFDFPPVYRAVDGLVGFPNVSDVFANVCTILAILSVQNFVYLSLIPHRPEFRMASLAAAGVTLPAMAALFFVTGPIHEVLDDQPYYGRPWTLIAHRAIYLAYLSLSGVVFTAILSRFALVRGEARFKVGFGLMAAGGAFGLFHVLNNVGGLFPPNLRPLQWWGEPFISQLLVPPFFLLLVTGGLMPAWHRALRTLRAHVAFLRLRSLWRELRDVCPEVALLPNQPLWKEMVNPREVSFRLHQQVAEIRDAAFLVSAFSHPRAISAIAGIGEGIADLKEREALEEAVQLRLGIEGKRRGLLASRAGSDAWRAPSGDFEEEVAHLLRVARLAARSAPMRPALEKIIQEGEMAIGAASPEVERRNG